MKTAVFVLCLFCAASAAAQAAAGAVSGQAQPLRMCEHPEHASHHELAAEQSLLPPQSTYHYEQGERPLWEFGPVSQPVPLGDVARAYRAGHVLVRKAEVTLEK
jgi:hypothetical protein